MKRFLLGLFLFFSCSLGANADVILVDTDNVNMKNFWEKNGKDVEKIQDISSKIINANKLDKNVSVLMTRNMKTINAEAHFENKTVYIYTGLLPYIDNDDELAYIISHEIAHCLDFYDGYFKAISSMYFNSKSYETKADLKGIDMMVKAGYNPVAAICTMKKIGGEYWWDSWIFISHPKSTTRMVNMYKHIYNNYPWALKTDMIHNINYENFTFVSQKEINAFLYKKKERSQKNKIEDL